jgi:putative DNA primase/helicase
VDRFRFDDKGEGRWYCNHCGAGDGFSLLCQKFGYDFVEAKKRVEKAAGVAQVRKASAQVSDSTKRARLAEVWNRAVPYAEGMRDYLLSRGIPERLHNQTAMRWHPSLRCSAGGHESAAIVLKCYHWDAQGRAKPATIQRHWVNLGTKMMMPSPIKLDGIFCPLGGAPDRGALGVCEGYTTALSVMAMQEPGMYMPVWSCMSAEQLVKFTPPPNVTTLFIFIDVDKSFTGQAAGYALAKRLHVLRPDLEIVVCYPTYNQNVDVDFNDNLKELACLLSSNPSPMPADAATPSASHGGDCLSTPPSTSDEARSCADPAARDTTGSIPTAPMDASSADTPVGATTTHTRTTADEATAGSIPS